MEHYFDLVKFKFWTLQTVIWTPTAVKHWTTLSPLSSKSCSVVRDIRNKPLLTAVPLLCRCTRCNRSDTSNSLLPCCGLLCLKTEEINGTTRVPYSSLYYSVIGFVFKFPLLSNKSSFDQLDDKLFVVAFPRPSAQNHPVLSRRKASPGCSLLYDFDGWRRSHIIQQNTR